MHRLPQIVVLISAAVALILFAIASWLQGMPSVAGSNSELPLPSLGEVRGDSALRTTSASAACGDVEEEIRRLVNESRACRSDNDCAVFDYGYPIECLTSVSRASIGTLRQNFERYHESCEYRVYYDCVTEDANRRPVCEAGQCRIELDTIESLKKETLDYLRPDSR